jgi:hypothetical protein
MQDLADRKLTNKLQQLYRVAALGVAMGMTEAEAASHAHVTETQLMSYMRDPRFQAMLEEFNSNIEKKIIERVIRRRFRIQAKAQYVAEEALTHAVEIMRTSSNDSVRWSVIRGILRQAGVDMDSTMLGDDIDPEEKIRSEDPAFFKRHDEVMEELNLLEAGEENA